MDIRETGSISTPEFEKKSVIETIFGNIFNSVLNDPTLIEDIKSLENETFALVDQLVPANPAWQGL